jgi:bifunctional non-homologous end joining protein LigD
MLWDRGGWEPKGDHHVGLKKGHLAFTLHGERLKSGWDLIRMRGDEKKENWLLIKEKDHEALSDGAAGKFLEQVAMSVSTRRSMDEIAVDAPPEQESKAPGQAISKLMADYPDVELATLVDAPPEGEQWLHEIKFDGQR